jgi:hypothetical protein
MREFKTTIREVAFWLLHGFREVGANFTFFGEAGGVWLQFREAKSNLVK